MKKYEKNTDNSKTSHLFCHSKSDKPLQPLYMYVFIFLPILRVRFGWTERPTSHRQTYRHPMACFTIQTACSYRWNEMKSCRASVVMKTQPKRNRYIPDLSQYVTWFSLLADHVIEIKYY